MNADRSQEFAEARELQWTWKTPAMQTMAVAIARLALARGTAGEFSANDLTLENHGGGGVAGAVFHRLAEDDVIAPVGAFVGGEFVQKFVKNAGGNRIGVWRLKSAARANRLIELHGGGNQPKLAQAELLPA